jgi:hypothetical protein
MKIIVIETLKRNGIASKCGDFFSHKYTQLYRPNPLLILILNNKLIILKIRHYVKENGTQYEN